MRQRSFALLAAAIVAAPAFTAVGGEIIETVNFDNGDTRGWMGNGGAVVQMTGANGYFRIPNTPSMFWFEFWNDSNPSFIGNYGAKGELLEFSVDVQTNHISVNGNPVSSRAVMLELRDYDLGDDFYDYASVYIELGRVSGFAQDWTTFSVVFDPQSTILPAGWGGYGNEDAMGNFILPDGVTFADVLAGVDEVAVHSAEPRVFYPFTTFDLAVDNITLSAVPTPGSAALLLAAGTGLLARRRRG